ncbi:MAG: serine/threonine protein kinase, partial [Myxococcales bacterium]|nr:serine/threonine protein kinase [Myxococcales bacterium]
MTDEAGRGLDSKAQPSEMQPSETLGRYRLLERIAVGGMAEVYKAKSFGVEGFEKLLVIKRIVPELARHEQFVGMFVQEAKLAVQLSHNNIVQVFDLGRIDGEDGTASYFIAMEYVPGHDLQTLLEHLRKNKKPAPVGLCSFVAMEVAKALDHAHRRAGADGKALGIVHRDISPQNILLSFEGDVKVTDFGIAKA